MERQPEISPESKARREHVAWLADYGRWRAEHREALAMLAKVQAAILERESALEQQAAEIQAHQLEQADYCLAEYGPGTPDPEKKLVDHAKFTEKHERARQMYERTKEEHINIVAEVNKLFEVCKLAK
jgi:seryl-tRNA(Sec) selenium transferase